MLKLFLVEDEALIREGLRDNIPWEQFGYKFVGEAGDGEMALPLIRKARPDVLITDIKMPFMDGLELSKILHVEFPKMKIIIISGYDDFAYAREAIEIGVEQYLLKPITKAMLKKTLTELKDKIEQDMEQNDYQTMYQNEIHEYEQFNRRRLFEKILEGEISVSDIYQEAAKLNLELNASAYNLIFFGFQEKKSLGREEMEELSDRQELVLHYFQRTSQFILFRWNVNCYGLLMKGEAEDMDKLTQKAVENIQKAKPEESKLLDYYIAIGHPVERLSQLPECYREVNHFSSYRFIYPKLQVFSEETLAPFLNKEDEESLAGVIPSQMDPEIIKDFLQRGNSSEISDFVEGYLSGIKSALESRMFRDYVILNLRFTVMAHLESLGISQEMAEERLQYDFKDFSAGAENIAPYFEDLLQTCFYFGKREKDNQSKKILRKALEYIDENFTQESLSLNSVAEEIDVTSNYLSAVFSQGMEKTFVEYVTGKRMERAKKLLLTTDKSGAEIAQEVGYKDTHYFSFVFKKTQKMSPREFRAGKKEEE